MNASYYDPELPFLAELEKHVRARAEQAEERNAQAQASRRLTLNPVVGRMTRRVAILVGLLTLLAATALAASSLFSSSSRHNPLANHQGASVAVAHGLAGGDRWTLSLYTRNGQLCRALIVSAQAEASRCAYPPRTGQIGVSSLQSAQHGYIFGVAGPRVQTVRVHTGQTEETVQTHALASQTLVAGLPSTARYYIAILTRPPGAEDPPVTVTGLGQSHRRIDRAQIACLQEAGPPPCGP